MIVGLFNTNKQKIEFYSLFDIKKVQQTKFPFDEFYRQITVSIYNCNNNDMILIGNTNHIYFYSFKKNRILKTVTYFYFNVRGVFKGKNNSYYFFTPQNFFKIIDLKCCSDFYPLIKPQNYDFNESYFLLTAIFREDNLIINHKNKVIFYKMFYKNSKQRCKNNYFSLSKIIKIFFIFFLLYMLFKI